MGEQVQRYKQAFWALSEAVKLSRDAWQLWSNFALAAVRSGNFLPAARAVLQVTSASVTYHGIQCLVLHGQHEACGKLDGSWRKADHHGWMQLSRAVYQVAKYVGICSDATSAAHLCGW